MLNAAPPTLSEQARKLLGPQPRDPPWERDVGEQRQEMREYAVANAGAPEAVETIENLTASGVPVRLYRPNGAESEALVWYHGGAWSIGDLDSHNALCCALANRTGCAIVSVDYRLAPEHPYPAAVDDCWTAVCWTADHFARLAVGGDSAGGNLAAAIALRARDADLELALQLLIYPALDPGLDSPFVDDFVSRYERLGDWEQFGEVVRRGMRHAWDAYIPQRARQREQDASPLRATSVVGIAPAFVITAEHDLLRGDAEAYVDRLSAARIRADTHQYDQQVHGFYHLLEMMGDARDALERSASALQEAFKRQSRRS